MPRYSSNTAKVGIKHQLINHFSDDETSQELYHVFTKKII